MKESNSWVKPFILIWSGQLLSTLSSQIVTFSIIFWLSIKMNSAEVLALSTLSSMLPGLILGFFTGVLVDRWDRKRTMIIADIYIALVTLAVIIVIMESEVSTALLYAMLALRSIGTSFHTPAMEASVPLLAPQDKLMKVAGVDNMIFSISTIASPAIAAVMISALDISMVLWFDIIGALIACTTLLFVHIPSPERVRSEHKGEFRKFYEELLHGVREVIARPGLLWMFIFTVFASFAMVPVSALFPLMTLNHFAGNTYMMSVIEIAWGAGMLAGGALMSMKWFEFNNVKLINTMYVIIGATYSLSGLLPSSGYALFAILTALGGVAGAIFFGAFTVLLQSNLGSEVLGRVFSIHNSFIMIPAMLSLVITGYLADNIGLEYTFIISGLVLIATGFLSSLLPAVKSFAKLQQLSKN